MKHLEVWLSPDPIVGLVSLIGGRPRHFPPNGLAEAFVRLPVNSDGEMVTIIRSPVVRCALIDVLNSREGDIEDSAVPSHLVPSNLVLRFARGCPGLQISGENGGPGAQLAQLQVEGLRRQYGRL